MTAQAKKKTAAKKTAVKKAAGKKTAGRKKTVAKKTTAKKTAAKKTAAKKTAVKKTAAKKTAAKKAAAKKPAAESQTAPPPVEEQIEAVAAETAAAPDGKWNPSIVVFACNWCSYAGADTAGVSRLQHQPHFRTIRVMCSGRVHPGFVMRAFEKGADGVLVSGCHIGDCHYVSGNERQLEIFEITKQLTHLVGLEPERVRLEWVSAAEGPKWAALINEFTDQIRALGPSPLKDQPTAG
jgi:F420-non-reducing hydrogenase iron-sulfur subunit